jgi:CcmD family protein
MESGNLVFLFAAFLVVWVGLLLYLLNLSGRISSLRRELDELESED